MKRQIIKLLCPETAFITKVISILNLRLADRGCEQFELSDSIDSGGTLLLFDIGEYLREEEYSLETLPQGGLKIIGGTETAILYGIGKMLRTASYENGCFEYGTWRGRSAPKKSFRAIYFATHFYNFYHLAPMEEIIKYLEDLALLGYNALMMWADKHHYENAEDPDYINFCERLKSIYKAAAFVGLKPILGVLCNEGFSTTPEALRARPTGRSFYGCEICPASDDGMDLILKNHEKTLEIFSELEIYAYSLWSYDQGGCGCEKCYPWGSNGMYKSAGKVAILFHKYFPEGKIIYSTWLFDYRGEKEWEGFYEKLCQEKNDWLKYLCVDSHNEFPEFPLKNRKPEGIKLINFPEISMWGMFPWGGFGANPLPERFRRLWKQASDICDGGFPYSEGIYEDFNKALYAGFYWNGDNEISETMREYFNYEFGSCDYDDLSKAIGIMEQNHGLYWQYKPGEKITRENVRFLKNKPGILSTVKEYKNTCACFDILQAVDKKIPEWAEKSWRWRIVYLRGEIDMLLDQNKGEPDQRCEDILKELAGIYHANNKMYRINPVTDEFIAEEKKRLETEKQKNREILEI